MSWKDRVVAELSTVRGQLHIVVVGLMSVSINGQVDSIAPRLGHPPAVLFALSHDYAAIIATNCLLKSSSWAVRILAGLALAMAAYTGASLNAWHVRADKVFVDGKWVLPPLPPELGLLIGVEPIVLIVVMTLLVAARAAEEKKVAEAAVAATAAAAAAERQRLAAAARSAQGSQAAHTMVTAGAGASASTHVLAAPPADRQAAPSGRTVRPDRQVAPSGSTVTLDRQVAPSAPAVTPGRQVAGPDRQVAAGPSLGKGFRAERPAVSAAATGRTSVSSRVVQAALPTAPAAAGESAAPEGPAPLRVVLDESGPRPSWMSNRLVREVAEAMIAAATKPKPQPYGRSKVMKHLLDDGTRVTSYKAQDLIDFIGDHDVIRAAA